jgi:hypothetical protein
MFDLTRPLEWSSNWGTVKAETPIGHYFIESRRDGSFDCRLEDVWEVWASSIEAAKAAAQADYERRIRSALEADGGGEALPSGKWEIDNSTGTPILVYDKCSVIESEQAYYLLGLIQRAATPPDERAVEALRWPQPGDKMRFLNKNGYPDELQAAQIVFAPWAVYTVKSCDVGSFDHRITFEGIDGRWNGVMFDFATDAALTQGESR